MTNSATKICLDSKIVALSQQLMDGLISVTEFCEQVTRYGWTVSEIHTDRKEITFCFDTGNTDRFEIPIIQWQTLIIDSFDLENINHAN